MDRDPQVLQEPGDLLAECDNFYYELIRQPRVWSNRLTVAALDLASIETTVLSMLYERVTEPGFARFI